jgi:hypothetical protein
MEMVGLAVLEVKSDGSACSDFYAFRFGVQAGQVKADNGCQEQQFELASLVLVDWGKNPLHRYRKVVLRHLTEFGVVDRTSYEYDDIVSFEVVVCSICKFLLASMSAHAARITQTTLEQLTTAGVF